jgi:hypothetical protein
LEGTITTNELAERKVAMIEAILQPKFKDYFGIDDPAQAALKEYRPLHWSNMVVTVLALGLTIGLMLWFDPPLSVWVGVIVSVATVCLAANISSGISTIYASLALLTFASMLPDSSNSENDGNGS